MTAPLPLLSLLEARVLGVLVEKQHTVPDTYPLTLNALTAGCNQKTSRDPVLNATDAEVQVAIDRLKALALVVESSGGRVMRYAHNAERALGVPSQAVALLATFMLRGTQTVGELRINSERLHRFADVSAVDGFLRELAARADAPMVAELPRAPGERENRWSHLLCGTTALASAIAAAPVAADAVISLTELAALRQSVSQLRADVDRLEANVASLRKELGAGT
ncbi:MAG: YceH family protein [Casimicrobiaceae bacterium]